MCVCVCVCVPRTGSNQPSPLSNLNTSYGSLYPPPTPADLFAITPVYPTAQKSSVGQVYRVQTVTLTDALYSKVCAVLNNINIVRAHSCLHLPIHLLYGYHWRPTSLATVTNGLLHVIMLHV